MPAGPITNTRPALNPAAYYNRYAYYSTNIAVYLPEGTNCIAAEVHLSAATASATNGVMGFDMELIGAGYPAAPLSIAPAGNNSITVRWPVTNWGDFSLYAATNLSQTNSWSVLTDIRYTNGGLISITQSIDSVVKFYRLLRP